MRTNNISPKIFITACVLLICVSIGFGQSFFDKLKDKVKGETKNQSTGAKEYCFARIEVRSSWEEKGEKVNEFRVYYSNISPYQSGDTRMIANLAEYFTDGVVTPQASRGIELEFYDSDITIYPASYAFETVQEAQKAMDERMESDKSNKTTIYTFVWKYNESATGEATTQPKRIFSVKSAPGIENTKAQSNNDASEREALKQKEKQENEIAQQNKEIWGFALIKVRVRNAKGEEFSRTYVSEISPVTRDDYNAFYNTDERIIKPRIWEYFAATVVAAAKARGEKIEEPDGSSIMYKFSLDRDSDLKPLFLPKKVLDEPRTREIGYAKDSSRPVFYFRWDSSGKNVRADLQREIKRNGSALPN
jgi:hypothetical protein